MERLAYRQPNAAQIDIADMTMTAMQMPVARIVTFEDSADERYREIDLKRKMAGGPDGYTSEGMPTSMVQYAVIAGASVAALESGGMLAINDLGGLDGQDAERVTSAMTRTVAAIDDMPMDTVRRKAIEDTVADVALQRHAAMILQASSDPMLASTLTSEDRKLAHSTSEDNGVMRHRAAGRYHLLTPDQQDDVAEDISKARYVDDATARALEHVMVEASRSQIGYHDVGVSFLDDLMRLKAKGGEALYPSITPDTTARVGELIAGDRPATITELAIASDVEISARPKPPAIYETALQQERDDIARSPTSAQAAVDRRMDSPHAAAWATTELGKIHEHAVLVSQAKRAMRTGNGGPQTDMTAIARPDLMDGAAQELHYMRHHAAGTLSPLEVIRNGVTMQKAHVDAMEQTVARSEPSRGAIMSSVAAERNGGIG